MADGPRTGSGESSPQVERGWGALKQHVIDNKVQVGLWVTRIFSILFTIGYIIPLFGNRYNAYYKVLMSSAATSALRLHQRVPRVQFNMQFVEQLLLEDSCHYLLYSLIFLYVSPVLLVLAPVVLFAIMHSASYSLTLLDCLGQNSWWGARLSISLVEFQSRNILRFCALCEIMVLPLTIILVFSGQAGLFTPFIYYQFLKMRLSSRRNPFTRNLFYEMRSALTAVSAKPAMPGILRWLTNLLLTVTQQMVPQYVQQQQ
ncbi:Krueppel homolog 2 [Venturia canescens]|uniref:Krueppel homolog 2 n=1 Tax=Venturia canescens TaxID=32260 RepID=UPI001C9C91D6|nr:Krueppel homolog 2 [Venturia canescens]XP_043266437.1 Krueppel homolog 2 [Venturia canescens]